MAKNANDKPPGYREYIHKFAPPADDRGPFPVPDVPDVDVINVGDPSTWKRVNTPCKSGQHVPVLDETENSIEGHVGYKCAKCGIGWIVKEQSLVNN